jgi:hypothetical protein
MLWMVRLVSCDPCSRAVVHVVRSHRGMPHEVRATSRYQCDMPAHWLGWCSATTAGKT